jgi:TPR repeat protein
MAKTNFPESLNREFELIEARQSPALLSNFRVRAKASGRQEYMLRLLDPPFWSDKSIIRNFHDFFSRFSEISNRAYIPHVRSVVGALNGPTYVLEEYVTGVSLNQFLQEPSGQALTAKDLAGICYRVCEALHHAHQKDIFHLCVTPQDIIIQENNPAKIKLGGFGTQLFSEAGKTTQFPAQLKKYLAPEVIEGRAFGPYSDVYSLSVTIGEVLPGVVEWRDILKRCVSRNPSDRFARVRDFAKALQELAEKPKTLKTDDPLCPIESRGGLVPVLDDKMQVEDKERVAPARKSHPSPQPKRIEPDLKPSSIVSPAPKSASFKILAVGALVLALLAVGLAVYFYQSKEKEIAKIKQDQVLANLAEQKRIADQAAKDKARKDQEEDEERERRRREERDKDLPTFALSYPEDAKDLLWKAIKGDTAAQTEMAIRYANGQGGVPKKDGEAVTWFYQAAEKGNDSRAQYHLGRIYEEGIGRAIDCSKALKWYRNAAEQGNRRALCRLGNMYENGRCVSRDLDQARKWYCDKAATSSNLGLYNLGVSYENSGNLVEAMNCFRKACQQDAEKTPD